MKPAFTWTTVGGASGYVIQVNDVSAIMPAIYTVRVTDPTWTPPNNLVSGRTYTWQVRAVNAAGLGGWSSLAQFTLGKVVPIGPGGLTSGSRPTFTWAGLAGATTYQVRVDDLTTGQSMVYMPIVSNDQAWTPGVNLTSGHTYKWWVRAVVPGPSAGVWFGAWSIGTTFQVM
jgi:hypothetical protein